MLHPLLEQTQTFWSQVCPDALPLLFRATDVAGYRYRMEKGHWVCDFSDPVDVPYMVQQLYEKLRLAERIPCEWQRPPLAKRLLLLDPAELDWQHFTDAKIVQWCFQVAQYGFNGFGLIQRHRRYVEKVELFSQVVQQQGLHLWVDQTNAQGHSEEKSGVFVRQTTPFPTKPYSFSQTLTALAQRYPAQDILYLTRSPTKSALRAVFTESLLYEVDQIPTNMTLAVPGSLQDVRYPQMHPFWKKSHQRWGGGAQVAMLCEIGLKGLGEGLWPVVPRPEIEPLFQTEGVDCFLGSTPRLPAGRSFLDLSLYLWGALLHKHSTVGAIVDRWQTLYRPAWDLQYDLLTTVRSLAYQMRYVRHHPHEEAIQSLLATTAMAQKQHLLGGIDATFSHYLTYFFCDMVRTLQNVSSTPLTFEIERIETPWTTLKSRAGLGFVEKDMPSAQSTDRDLIQSLHDNGVIL